MENTTGSEIRTGTQIKGAIAADPLSIIEFLLNAIEGHLVNHPEDWESISDRLEALRRENDAKA